MKNVKYLLLLPAFLLMGCNGTELDRDEAKRRVNNITTNYLPILKTNYDIKYVQTSYDKKGKVVSKKEMHYVKEDHFGVHYEEKNTGEAINFLDFYAISDASGDKIRYANYDYGDAKDQFAYVSKDIDEDDSTLSSTVNAKYKNGVSSIENYAYNYQDISKTFTIYQDYMKFYGVGDEDVKIVVNYKEKDLPAAGDYNLKTDITAIYKDRKISSYKETTTTTGGAKSVIEFKISYDKPDIKLPKNWKDYTKDYVAQR